MPILLFCLTVRWIRVKTIVQDLNDQTGCDDSLGM